MVPVPSRSDSAIIRRTSSRFGSKPIARIATLSSSASIVPESSVSKSLNASRISSLWSAVRRAIVVEESVCGGAAC